MKTICAMWRKQTVVNNMKKALYIGFAFFLLMPSYAMASAGDTWSAAFKTLSQSIGSGADTDSRNKTRPTFDAGDFVMKAELAGLGNGSHEYDKIYSIVAEKRFKNGVCLRPVQISCYAKSGHLDDTSHTRYKANGDVAACQVYCADGFTGSDCSTKITDATSDGSTKSPASDWRSEEYTFSGQEGSTSYESDTLSAVMYAYAHKWYKNQEADILLGVTKFTPNGVKVAPVTVVCGSRRANKDDHIFVKLKSVPAGEVLLCTNGYTPNQDKTDCVEFDSAQVAGVVVQNESGSYTKKTDEKQMSLYDTLKAKPGYDEKIHQIIDTGSTLAIVCKNHLHGFVSPDSLECVECISENSAKSGVARPANGIAYGVCVKCPTGKIFDVEANQCEDALALSKSDMQYGQDMRTKSSAVVNQCWTKVSDPDEYKNCILNKQDVGGVKVLKAIGKKVTGLKAITKL